MKRVLTWLFILSFIAGGITAWWFWHDMQQQLDSPINIESDTAIIYTIKPGMNLKLIGEDLVRQGIMKHPYYFMLDGRLQGTDSRLKAGEYLLHPGTTQRQLLEQFEAGKVVQHSLALIEGW